MHLLKSAKIVEKLKVSPPPPGKRLSQKGREVSKMIKVTILSEKFAIHGSFDEKTSKMGTKWPKGRTSFLSGGGGGGYFFVKKIVRKP